MMVGRVTPCAPSVRFVSQNALNFSTLGRRARSDAPYLWDAALRDLPPLGRFATLPCVDLPVRKKLPHTIPQWVAEGSWFFITINCAPPGKNQLCRAGTGEAVLAAMKFNHNKLVWHCRLCLLMP